jgi:hypothetical protein
MCAQYLQGPGTAKHLATALRILYLETKPLSNSNFSFLLADMGGHTWINALLNRVSPIFENGVKGGRTDFGLPALTTIAALGRANFLDFHLGAIGTGKACLSAICHSVFRHCCCSCLMERDVLSS